MRNGTEGKEIHVAYDECDENNISVLEP